MGTQLLLGMDSGSAGTPRTGMLHQHPLWTSDEELNRAEELGFHNAHQALLGNKESWLKAKFYFLKCVKNGLVTARSPPP